MERRAMAALALVLFAACRPADAHRTVDSDEAMTAKLNLYVACVNQVSRQILDDDAVEVSLAPAIAERCLGNLDRAVATRPPLPALEAAGAAYGRALRAYQTTKERTAFDRADADLRGAIDDVQHILDDHALARLEKDGGLAFHARRVVARGEAMVKAVAAGDSAVARPMGEYLAAARALEEALARGDPQAEVAGPVTLFASSARRLVDHARANAVPELVDEYNRMVGYWNMLTWRR